MTASNQFNQGDYKTAERGGHPKSLFTGCSGALRSVSMVVDAVIISFVSPRLLFILSILVSSVKFITSGTFGENDRNNEVCRFEIVFNNDHENRYTYNLNRNFVKPLIAEVIIYIIHLGFLRKIHYVGHVQTNIPVVHITCPTLFDQSRRPLWVGGWLSIPLKM